MDQNESGAKADQAAVTFQAVFVKAQTMVDGCWRVSFDVSPKHAADLIELSKLMNKYLQVAVVQLPKGAFNGG
jgi:glucan biosynthesis protein